MEMRQSSGRLSEENEEEEEEEEGGGGKRAHRFHPESPDWVQDCIVEPHPAHFMVCIVHAVLHAV